MALMPKVPGVRSKEGVSDRLIPLRTPEDDREHVPTPIHTRNWQQLPGPVRLHQSCRLCLRR
jgi:hypothetical protein